MITRLEELPNCEPLHTGSVETGVSIFQYLAFISVSATNTKRYAAASEMGVCLGWKSTVGLARARHILISFADPSTTPMPPWNLTPPMSVVADQSRPTCVQGGI